MILSYTLCCTKQKLLANFSIITQKLKKKGGSEAEPALLQRQDELVIFHYKVHFKTAVNQILPSFFSRQDLGSQSSNAVCKVKYVYIGESGFSRHWQSWCQWLFESWKNLESHLNHPTAFLVSQHILQRLHENTRNWHFVEEMCETIIMKLSNLDGQGDVNRRLNTGGGHVRKQKQNGKRWLQLKSVLRSNLVSNHSLKILGNQREAKNIHNFGAGKKLTCSYSSWNKNNKKKKQAKKPTKYPAQNPRTHTNSCKEDIVL